MTATGQEISRAADLQPGNKIVDAGDELVIQAVIPVRHDATWVRLRCVYRSDINFNTTRTVPADQRFELKP